MATQIANPPMPVLTPIQGGFLHGKIVRIQGTLSPAAQRFAINLQCGPNTNPRDDLALHFNARIHERAVVRNSLIGGHWGQEERHGPFPFVPGQGFEILLMADAQNYKIAINGQHFAEFRCRTPMERVSYLSADGEIMIHMISFEGGSHQHHGVPGHGMQAPMPMPMPMPMPGMPHAPSHHGPHQHPTSSYPAGGMPGYPTGPMQPSMPYPAQPGMPGMYPAPGMPPVNYSHLSPKSAPYPDPYAPYPDTSVSGGNAGSGSGLSGLINKASTAVAGLGLASGVTGILGSLTGGGHRSSGYPAAGYPAAGYPGQQPGFMSHTGGSGVGGLLGGLGTAGGLMGAAAMGSALLNPKKAAKKQAKAQKKAMKYGLAGVGVGAGAYALHHGMKHHHHHGYHGHSSSSSSSSEEE